MQRAGLLIHCSTPVYLGNLLWLRLLTTSAVSIWTQAHRTPNPQFPVISMTIERWFRHKATCGTTPLYVQRGYVNASWGKRGRNQRNHLSARGSGPGIVCLADETFSRLALGARLGWPGIDVQPDIPDGVSGYKLAAASNPTFLL